MSVRWECRREKERFGRGKRPEVRGCRGKWKRVETGRVVERKREGMLGGGGGNGKGFSGGWGEGVQGAGREGV